MTKFLIIGAGAIGGFYGGKLHQAGAEVSLVARSDYHTIKENGITIKSTLGDFHYTPKQTLKTPEDYNDTADYIILSTKVLPEIKQIELLSPVVTPSTTIVLLQNGIKIEPPIRNSFPNNPLISALAFVCVSRTTPGEIKHTDYGRLVIGNYPTGLTKETKALSTLFEKSGITCKTSEEIECARWTKLIWNAPFNPLSILEGNANTAQMLDSEPKIKLARAIMKEVQILAKADGYELTESLIEKNIKETQTMVPYKTSMLLDYENKRPIETDAILKNAIQFADQQKIQVPYLNRLFHLLRNI